MLTKINKCYKNKANVTKLNHSKEFTKSSQTINCWSIFPYISIVPCFLNMITECSIKWQKKNKKTISQIIKHVIVRFCTRTVCRGWLIYFFSTDIYQIKKGYLQSTRTTWSSTRISGICKDLNSPHLFTC